MEITAKYQDEMGEHSMGNVLNISLGGTYVQTRTPLSKGVMTILELQDSFQGTLVQVGGMVVRSDASRGMALEFMDKDHSGIKKLIKGIRRTAVKDALGPDRAEHRDAPRLRVLSNDFQMTKRSRREQTNGDHVKKEKRRATRKLLRIEARYQDPESKILKGVLRNISLSGLYIETPNTLEAQTKIHMCLDATDLGKVIDVSGHVVRVDENKGMAVEFDDKESREIRLLLSSLRKLDQASMLALIRSGLGD